MANRNYSNGGKIYSMHVKPVIATCQITIGASGAVASFKGSLVGAVTHTATGTYQISMATKPSVTNFRTILHTSHSMQSPSSGVSGIVAIECQYAPTTSMSSPTAPSLTIKTLGTSDTAADPAAGSVISVMIYANDSSVPQ